MALRRSNNKKPKSKAEILRIEKAKAAAKDRWTPKPFGAVNAKDQVELNALARNNPGQNALELLAQSKAQRSAQLQQIESDAVSRRTRMAADDPLVAEAIEYLNMERLLDAAYEARELRSQNAIASNIAGGDKELRAFMDKDNPSQTVEQQIGRDLVFKGIIPEVIPSDRILGKDITDQQLGIDGTYRPDSEIRRHVTGNVDEAGVLNLNRSDVRTEILSPQGIEESYEAWKNNAFNNDSRRDKFNTAAHEYYGQQALKLMGATPVTDNLRSEDVIRAFNKGKEASTVGTDRLVENSVRLRDKDVSQSADFRFMKPGQSKPSVIDYQVGERNDEREMNMQLLKTSNVRPNSVSRLEQDVKDMAQKLVAAGVNPDLDIIFNELQKQGKLAPTVMTTAEQGTRPGKFMSDAPIMGDINIKDQYRMSGVLYGIVDHGDLRRPYGMLPKEFRYYGSNQIRNHVGKLASQDKLTDKLFSKAKGAQPGNLYFKAPTLNKSGQEEGMLSKDINRQFSEPYTFDSLNKVVQMAQGLNRAPISAKPYQNDYGIPF